MAYVYKHTKKDNNIVFYIGIGKYISRAYSNKGRSKHWNNVVNKHGYFVEIIEKDLDWNTACEREKYWINFYGRLDLDEGTLVNMTNGGDGQVDRIISVDTKLKLKLANIDKQLSPEHKTKISNSSKGKKLSDIHKQSLSNSLTGKPHSYIHNLNISKSMKEKMVGKTHSAETKEKIRNSVLKKIAEKAKKDH